MDRKELEQLWRSRVADTKSRLDLARNRTKAIVRDFPLDGTSADGRYVYQSALRLENAAKTEYRRVLRICTDLIIRGIVPDEGDWPRRKGAVGSE